MPETPTLKVRLDPTSTLAEVGLAVMDGAVTTGAVGPPSSGGEASELHPANPVRKIAASATRPRAFEPEIMIALPNDLPLPVQAQVTGKWSIGAGLPNFVGAGYRYRGAKETGAVRYEFKIETAGEYEVRMNYSEHENRATKAPVTVESADGILTICGREDPFFVGGLSIHRKLKKIRTLKEVVIIANATLNDTDLFPVAQIVGAQKLNRVFSRRFPVRLQGLRGSRILDIKYHDPFMRRLMPKDLGISILLRQLRHRGVVVELGEAPAIDTRS